MSLKNPNWNDSSDRALYNRLFYYSNGEELTPDEENFVKTMYHYEEYACGLDGDR